MSDGARVTFRRATPADLPRLDAIREAAFSPVFSSFRTVLGSELYDLTQARDDEGQAALLASLLASGSEWEVYSATKDGAVAGFVALRLDRDKLVGEIGLNAVDPAYGGRGLGTAMYEFALARMREAGMRAAAVSTGGDDSHAPARRAYEKAGFAAAIPAVWLCRAL
jgi:ribosomal protein S18 acetylase RimI-like enzyme